MSTTAAPLRWGILACGKISNDFVLAIQHYGERPHQVVGVATSNSAERAKQFCERVGGLDAAKHYGSYEELLADPQVEVVYIGNLNSAHREWAVKALDAGKHVLCEKPMAVNVKQVREMVDASQRNKRFLMEAFWSRFFPVYKQLGSLSKSGWGQPLVAHANFGVKLVEDRHCPETGETPLMDIGLYTVQFALFVFGGIKPEKIEVHGGALDAKGGDRWANITLHFGGGKHAVLYYNGDLRLPNNAWVVFDKGGQVQIPEFFWCPTRMWKFVNPDATPGKKDPDEVVDVPLGDEKHLSQFNFNNSSGLHYEADCVHDCIRTGQIECSTMSHAESLIIAEVLEEVRHQLGVVLGQDK